MGRFKDKMMEEEQEFWDDCIDMMKESEVIQEFWGQYNAAEKDGSIKRPEYISMTEFEEAVAEAWHDLWADYQ
tara:strand:- start:428 stop:646 length:219 start_codon:yes stop_codon:yes gene_type:complete